MAKLNINGKSRDVQVEDDTPLLWVIREQLGLTGTKYGCGVAQCGACSVHFKGAVDVPQGGYCQSGQIMAAAALLRKKANPTDDDIDAAMTNICRCGTYQRIRAAVHMAAGEAREATAGAGAEINTWVVVKPDDTCVIRIARSEMGQGTRTGLAQLVAEELECDWKKVATESITPGQNLSRKRIWGEMGTGGSRGIRTSQDYVRRGGAAARMMLLQAAADEWNVPVAEVSVADGVITHAASGRKTTYGKVAAAAAKLAAPDPKSITLKNPSDWKIAGKPVKRLDT